MSENDFINFIKSSEFSKKNSRKGLSPLVATILLIAFVVAVASIIATWISGFARTQTELVTEQSQISITCSYGNINLKSAKFSDPYLSGTVENIGQIALGNISLSVIYQNATSEKIGICASGIGTSGVRCDVGNLSLSVSEQSAFNVTAGSNYDEIRVITNCSTVTDTIKRSDVS